MISSAFPAAHLTRAAAVALLLAAAGFAGTAYADDEYGTGTAHETVIRQAARSAGQGGPSIASMAPVTSIGGDVVGANGPQDTLARQIFHPGSGTDW